MSTQDWAEEKSLEILKRLADEHGDEAFVADGYGYHDDAKNAFAKALREALDMGLEKAANKVDQQSYFGMVAGMNIRALKSERGTG